MNHNRHRPWKKPLPLPKHVSPRVRRLFELLNEQKMTIPQAAWKAGIASQTISKWRYETEPSDSRLEAVLNVLHHKLIVVPV